MIADIKFYLLAVKVDPSAIPVVFVDPWVDPKTAVVVILSVSGLHRPGHGLQIRRGERPLVEENVVT